MIAGLRAHGTEVKFVSPVGPLFCRFAYRDHKKIIVIDDRSPTSAASTSATIILPGTT
jgi:phosphatidylserine/phosphatidylglycerophosphate/cardiolipin synthase-like enzyme